MKENCEREFSWFLLDFRWKKFYLSIKRNCRIFLFGNSKIYLIGIVGVFKCNCRTYIRRLQCAVKSGRRRRFMLLKKSGRSSRFVSNVSSILWEETLGEVEKGNSGKTEKNETLIEISYIFLSDICGWHRDKVFYATSWNTVCWGDLCIVSTYCHIIKKAKYTQIWEVSIFLNIYKYLNLSG